MKINNTNSQNFRGRFFVVGSSVSEGELRLFKTNIRILIQDGCGESLIPFDLPYRTEWVEGCKFFFKQPFITGKEDVFAYRQDYPRAEDFIPQENTLDLLEVLKAIREGKFDFLNGKILKK